MEHNWEHWSINREKFGALLKSIIGNFKSIIGACQDSVATWLVVFNVEHFLSTKITSIS